MKNRTALILGVTGQDGAHLASHLLNQSYSVYGGFRRGSNIKTWRLEHLGILSQIKLVNINIFVFRMSAMTHSLQLSEYRCCFEAFIKGGIPIHAVYIIVRGDEAIKKNELGFLNNAAENKRNVNLLFKNINRVGNMTMLDTDRYNFIALDGRNFPAPLIKPQSLQTVAEERTRLREMMSMHKHPKSSEHFTDDSRTL